MTPNKLGEMRLGGMTPASYFCELPATFGIIKTIHSGNELTIFGQHNGPQPEKLIWIDQTTIKIQEQEIKLQIPPSARTNWSTFTIKQSDLNI